MDDLNLITCINYMKKIVFRLENFIDDECSDFSCNSITLEDIDGLKEGYAQLIWVEEIYIKLFEKINNVKFKYGKKIEPIISNLKYTVTKELKTINKNYKADESFKLPLFNIFHQDIDLLSFNSWVENQKCYSNIDEIASIHELGWPGGINNIKPLKKILFNTYRNCIGTPRIEFISDIDNKNQDISCPESIKNEIPIIGEYSYNCSGFKLLLPIIKSLDSIPQNLYYFKGDKKNKKGVYSRISNRIIIKVPMIETIPENTNNSKQMIIKCNNGVDCTFWNCTYAHPGVPYNKIGYIKRAPSCPGFSNFDTISSDIKVIKYNDIRTCLMYSITDLFAIKAWCQDQDDGKKNIIIWKNLDICGDYINPFSIEKDIENEWNKLN